MYEEKKVAVLEKGKTIMEKLKSQREVRKANKEVTSQRSMEPKVVGRAADSTGADAV